MKFVSVFFVSQ